MGIFTCCVFLFIYFYLGALFAQEKLKVSVYYESKCPDARRFITKQLYPTYQALGGYSNPYFSLEFIPYGIAKTVEHEDGNCTFKCHHGKRECQGNEVHACALKYLPPESHLPFVYCNFKDFDPPDSGPKCAKKLSLDFSGVEKCLKNDGPRILASNGNRTHSLIPKLDWIPWIMFNDQWTKLDMDESQKNFSGVLCKKVQGIPRNKCDLVAKEVASKAWRGISGSPVYALFGVFVISASFLFLKLLPYDGDF